MLENYILFDNQQRSFYINIEKRSTTIESIAIEKYYSE